MVRLDRIYTGAGDTGQTSLGDGSRVQKTAQRVVTMGAVDELNCHLGTAAALTTDKDLQQLLNRIQQLLFDLGGDLCSPLPVDRTSDQCPRIEHHHWQWLETEIDAANGRLDPLNSFILPGGRPTAAALHLARSVCRRSEVEFLRLVKTSRSLCANPEVGVFLNRLSDLLFVLARCANGDGEDDILWMPGSAATGE